MKYLNNMSLSASFSPRSYSFLPVVRVTELARDRSLGWHGGTLKYTYPHYIKRYQMVLFMEIQENNLYL